MMFVFVFVCCLWGKGTTAAANKVIYPNPVDVVHLASHYASVSTYPFAKVVGVVSQVDEGSCKCQEMALPCPLEIREKSVVKFRGFRCAKPWRYCCRRKVNKRLSPALHLDLKEIAQTVALLPQESREAPIDSLEEPIVSSEEAIVSSEEAIVSAQEAIVSTEEAIVSFEEAIVSSEEATVSSEEAIVSSEEAIVSSEEAIVSSAESFEASKMSAEWWNDMPDIFSSSSDTDLFPSGSSSKNTLTESTKDQNHPLSEQRRRRDTQPNFARAMNSKPLPACSCATPDHCAALWHEYTDLPQVEVKSSLKCTEPREVTCCLGHVVRTEKERLAEEKRETSASSSSSNGSSLWQTAWTGLMSWLGGKR